ncbi:oligosaccharide flippase family protein [Agrobacterium larrymoorei]|uniref:Oligosaccharide flippase family protein n=1 Tax=Agrobacterium larrymoorei TaxID=160699 RepID=A0A4D7DUK0_9HYPH|nr:oligosaccharide flippase family protein [Agrobacterium larrymoorei]QCJ00814.1 hypothetical protein CFBP5473_22820 [Agrobacterium larrymoorei]QYA10478.1 oligosaccharide flippase family protein [Agrobacterium larrymoorei]
MSLKKIAFGTMSMSSISILRIAAQFFVMPILARFLSPHEYGTVTLAIPIVLLLVIFADAGVGQSLIKEDENNSLVWSSAFWLTAIIGVVLALVALFGASGLAIIFAEPDLGPITRGLALIAFLQAISAIPGVKLQKRGKFTTIAIIEVVAMAAGLTTALVGVLNGAGIWSLVLQQLAQYSIRAAFTFIASRFKPSFVFSLACLREHIVFGRSMLFSNLATNLSQSLELIIIGHALGAVGAGIFSMAFLFARLPGRILTGPLNYVIYTHLLPFRENKEKLGGVYLAISYLVAAFMLPMLFLASAAHQEIFSLVLGNKWTESGYLFALIAPFAGYQLIGTLAVTIRIVLGQVRSQMRLAIEFALAWCLLLAIFAVGGTTYIAGAFAVAVALIVPRNINSILSLLSLSRIRFITLMSAPTMISLLAASIYWVFASELRTQWYLWIPCVTGLTIIAIVTSMAAGYATLRKGLSALNS